MDNRDIDFTVNSDDELLLKINNLTISNDNTENINENSKDEFFDIIQTKNAKTSIVPNIKKTTPITTSLYLSKPKTQLPTQETFSISTNNYKDEKFINFNKIKNLTLNDCTTNDSIDYLDEFIINQTTSIELNSANNTNIIGSKLNRNINNNNKLIEKHNDNKENTIPIGSGGLCSPRMKLSDNVLSEQNSPHISDSPINLTMFTFSPKQINNSNENIIATTSTSTLLTTPKTKDINTSPLISSSFYKYGNYFKFPEVDCITPDKMLIETNLDNNQLLAANKISSSLQKSKFKSISFDFENVQFNEKNITTDSNNIHDSFNKSNFNNNNNNNISHEYCELNDENLSNIKIMKSSMLAHKKQKAFSFDSNIYLNNIRNLDKNSDKIQNNSQIKQIKSKSVPNTPNNIIQQNQDEKILLKNDIEISSNLLENNHNNLINIKKTTQNKNLKTLPEVLTINDFDIKPLSIKKSTINTKCPKSITKNQNLRGNILQRRGSNHSLTLNLSGSLSNLPKSFSVSNYICEKGDINLQSSKSSINLNQSQQQQLNTKINHITNKTTTTNLNSNIDKRNLLQRRGSNTNLTLNIKSNTSTVNLNRLNSYSALNISQNQNKIDNMKNLGRKGLLERRNSNTSLTLNIKNSTLCLSNINLNDSICSLTTNNSLNEYDEYHLNNIDNNNKNKFDIEQNYQHRKFLSSENLNNLQKISSKINQTHMRDSKKKCFGSVSDLKHNNELINENNDNSYNYDNIDVKLNESYLCSCTGVRNITTKPLSPQSTSEDFKMYLANIQLLQNSTNIMNSNKLRQLNLIFEKSYNTETLDIINNDIKSPKFIKNYDKKFNYHNLNDEKLLLRNLHQEFWELPTNYQEKPMVFGSNSKNRYKTILPNEHSRVLMDCEDGYEEEPYINANYIKGPEYIQNQYIATQGPMPNTIYEYWLMIYQNIKKFNETKNKKLLLNSANETKIIKSDNYVSKFDQKIAMLTNFVENNRQKCSIYFPVIDKQYLLITNNNNKFDNINLIKFYENYLIDDDIIIEATNPNIKLHNKLTNSYQLKINDDKMIEIIPKMNFFIIKNDCIIQKKGYSIRKLICLYCKVLEKDENNHFVQIFSKFKCYHYWFPDWPDQRSPNDIDVLLDMSLNLLENDKKHLDENIEIINQPPLIIHCSAGVGRTGCLAAILNGLQQMRTSIGINNKINNLNTIKLESLNVDVLGIVCNLRLQRGGMVQNSEQYELIHRTLCLYQKRLDMNQSQIEEK